MDRAKAQIHSIIATNKVFRDQIEGMAAMIPTRPKDPALAMAFDEGRRSYAAELMSIYREVEDEI